jgi:hypothetical protein
LPSAATTGFISADENLNSNNTDFTPKGPQRVGPDGGFGDPGAQPLGDAVPCLLLLALGYALYVRRKYGLPTRNSRSNE